MLIGIIIVALLSIIYSVLVKKSELENNKDIYEGWIFARICLIIVLAYLKALIKFNFIQ